MSNEENILMENELKLNELEKKNLFNSRWNNFCKNCF